MGLLDFLKRKELDRIAELNQLSAKLKEDNENLRRKIDSLSRFQCIEDAEAKAQEIIDSAHIEAMSVIRSGQNEAKNLMDRAKSMLRDAEKEKDSARSFSDDLIASSKLISDNLIKEARSKANEMKRSAQDILDNATLNARVIIDNANAKAKDISGEAFILKGQVSDLEHTLEALKNTIRGYGDDYIIPQRNFLDDLSDDFGYTEAGVELKKSRERTRLMVKNKTAAKCDYVEEFRKNTAIDFVIDAFNGKVDSILASVRDNNFGILRQKILDAFYLVNNLGKAFRNAVITDSYKDSRIDELKWAVICIELRNKDREEQRAIRERIREEERARREYEKAKREAEKEEAMIHKAMEKVKHEMEKASLEQKEKYESKLIELTEKLKEAEQKNMRALSMAQQTKSGHVYVISNIGSFGENVFKIGMTRRLEPEDRVRELGDASVPFPFDIHAMIYSEDAPRLETELHKAFVINQMNKVNPRKEFFKIPISEIRRYVDNMNIEAKWTMKADAYEWRESMAIEKNISTNSNEMEKWTNKAISDVDDENELEEEAISCN